MTEHSGRRFLSPPSQLKRLRRWLYRTRRLAWLGTLRRTTPLSHSFGYDRGQPIDRYYIENFLEANRQDIRGRVLEVKDSTYTKRFGGGVERSDVLDIDSSNAQATMIADLAAAAAIPSDTFDCFVLTQTLLLIYDTPAAVGHAHRILRPGGTLLVTVPALSRVIYKAGDGHDYWRFTPNSCARLFGDVFGTEQVTVQSYGNVLACVSFLVGMAVEDLTTRELDVHDELYPVIICVRAVKT